MVGIFHLQPDDCQSKNILTFVQRRILQVRRAKRRRFKGATPPMPSLAVSVVGRAPGCRGTFRFTKPDVLRQPQKTMPFS